MPAPPIASQSGNKRPLEEEESSENEMLNKLLEEAERKKSGPTGDATGGNVEGTGINGTANGDDSLSISEEEVQKRRRVEANRLAAQERLKRMGKGGGGSST